MNTEELLLLSQMTERMEKMDETLEKLRGGVRTDVSGMKTLYGYNGGGNNDTVAINGKGYIKQIRITGENFNACTITIDDTIVSTTNMGERFINGWYADTLEMKDISFQKKFVVKIPELVKVQILYIIDE